MYGNIKFELLQLHSEYRSTYKWHEFKEQQGVVKQPALSPAPPSVIPLSKGMYTSIISKYLLLPKKIVLKYLLVKKATKEYNPNPNYINLLF